ncbi:MAG: aminoglycoside phosphotransferase [Gammaproteobacteria bacterium]|nr:aminoglycoside phosphotransferase [Gammaproteobacteria bacterium]
MVTPPTHKSALNDSLMIVNSLTKADAFDHPVESIRVVETHISWLILTGQYAYKIKKPVDFGFLDFSTLAQRRVYCEEEVRLNRRLAKQIYLGVAAIVGSAENPKVYGKGATLEYAVKMRQFSGGQLLSDLADRGELGIDIIDQLGVTLAHFHENVARSGKDEPYGDSVTIKEWFEENFAQIIPRIINDSDKQQLNRLQQWGENQWRINSNLMTRRKQQGYIRECHGDLHLGNITMINRVATPFDCIEFNPNIRWIDTINELAFLLMDLIRYGYDRLAYRLLNQYLQLTGDYESVALLPYYLVYRALVRAKVGILRLQQCTETGKQEIQENFSRYLNLAERFTQSRNPMLLITHGFSGSGKSTFGKRLAEEIHALQIRSDIERKRLYGFTSHAKTGSGVTEGMYSQWANFKTYQHLIDLTKPAIEAGITVILDAAFLESWQRSMFWCVADSLGIPMVILDFTAREETLTARLQQRTNDASEADVAVLRHQQKTADPLLESEKAFTLTIDTEQDDSFDRLMSALKARSQ